MSDAWTELKALVAESEARAERAEAQLKACRCRESPYPETDRPCADKYEVTYFKTHNGKYYTTDEIVWPKDAPDHSGWNPLASFHRIKTMHAVCMNAPQGFPQFSPAQKAEDADSSCDPSPTRTAMFTYFEMQEWGKRLRRETVEAVAKMVENGNPWEGFQAEGNAPTIDHEPLFALRDAIVERIRDLQFTSATPKEKP